MFMKYLSAEGEGNHGKELDSLFPLMQSMIENILSKDILYPPMKQMVTKVLTFFCNDSTCKFFFYIRYC